MAGNSAGDQSKPQPKPPAIPQPKTPDPGAAERRDPRRRVEIGPSSGFDILPSPASLEEEEEEEESI